MTITNQITAVRTGKTKYQKDHTIMVENDHDWAIVAYADTREEAEQAKRAFENVLAPRFTRDEAIAIVKARYIAPDGSDETWRAYMRGIRLALEALAAAGVFSDDVTRDAYLRVEQSPEGMSVRVTERPSTMADKLDAAGIK